MTRADPKTFSLRTILIVEDNLDLAMLLNIRLVREGWETYVCTNPLEALKVLAAKEFDVLMTDQMMPEMAGSALIDSVRKKGLNTSLFVIYTGDLNMVETDDRKANNVWIVRKPTDIRALSNEMALAIQPRFDAAEKGEPRD